ncbi:hypothetical protein MRB53_041210 [Persea americana]|nr:hypothetical protein MRB53_041210 [Persea americana]
MSDLVRRSGRAKKKSAKYVADPLEGFDDERASASPSITRDVDDSEDDFRAEQIADEDHDESVHSDASVNSRGLEGDISVSEEETSLDEDDKDDVPVKKKRGPMPRITKETDKDEVHTRGLKALNKNSSKDKNLAYSLAYDQRLIGAIEAAKRRWLVSDAFPTKYSDSRGVGGLAASVLRPAGPLVCWKWYDKRGGGQRLRATQRSQVLQASEAERYTSRAVAVDVLLGRAEQYVPHSIAPYASTPFDAAWWPTGADTTHGGWVLNVGACVQSLEWMPSRDSKEEILAICTRDMRALRSGPVSAPRSDFAPWPPESDTIQLWSVPQPRSRSTDETHPSSATAPCLRLVVCVDWGPIRKMKWCPFLNDAHQDDSTGMLAIVTRDGFTRVLEIDVSDRDDGRSGYVHYKEAAFTVRPPDTVSSDVVWISTSALLVSTASGHVGIYSLALNTTKPVLYVSVQDSYILSLLSATPSFANLFVTVSTNGYTTLSQLPDPANNHVSANRARVAVSPLVWHDHTFHVFAADGYEVRAYNIRRFWKSLILARLDAHVTSLATSPVHASILIGTADGCVSIYNPMIKILSGRKAFVAPRRMFMIHDWRRGDKVSPSANCDRHNGASMSPGNAQDHSNGEDDESGAPNPDAMLVDPSPSTAKVSSERHTSQLPPSDTGPAKQIFPNGLARLVTSSTTNFDVGDTPAGIKAPTRLGKGNLKPTTIEGTTTVTIYEEESAVRCVSWCPNERAGGLGAIGWGSGLVWVGDLADRK